MPGGWSQFFTKAWTRVSTAVAVETDGRCQVDDGVLQFVHQFAPHVLVELRHLRIDQPVDVGVAEVTGIARAVRLDPGAGANGRPAFQVTAAGVTMELRASVMAARKSTLT